MTRHMRRSELWMLLAIVILAIGTTIALTRQQHIINEIQDSRREVAALNATLCKEAVEFRTQSAASFHQIASTPGIVPAVRDALETLAANAERVAAVTAKTCAQRNKASP